MDEEDNFSLEEWSDEDDDLLADLEVAVIFNFALHLTYYVVKELIHYHMTLRTASITSSLYI